MGDLRERWSALSRPWKTFWISSAVLIVFFIAMNAIALVPLAFLWAAGAATIVRLRDRFNPPDEEPRDRR